MGVFDLFIFVTAINFFPRIFNFSDILVKEPDILHKTPSPFMNIARLLLTVIKKTLQMNFIEKTKYAFHFKYISPRIVPFTKEL